MADLVTNRESLAVLVMGLVDDDAWSKTGLGDQQTRMIVAEVHLRYAETKQLGYLANID